MKTSTALISGLAGASIVTLTHETLRRVDAKAPRMDLLGMQALSKLLRAIDWNVPQERKLFTWTLVGDVISNTLYYSLIGIGSSKNALIKGSIIGLAAGIGGVVLPELLGLNSRYSNKTLHTKIATVGLYVVGGLVTAAVIKLMHKKQKVKHAQWEERLLTSSMV